MVATPDTCHAPQPKRWSRAEYRRLFETGILRGRYELIDGEIIQKMPKSPPHTIALILLAAWLEGVFGRLHVRTQDPVVVPSPEGAGSEPEPDIAVTRQPATAYAQEHPGPEELLLVCEVSETSLPYDLQKKAALYAAAGIPEYWMLDTMARRLYMHRHPAPDGYREVSIFTDTDEVSPLARPADSTAVAALLPPGDQAPAA